MSQFNKLERKSFLGRILNSLTGVIFGVLLVPSAVLLFSWNEYRTIHRTQGLTEAQQIVLTIENHQKIDSGLTGKLVHLAGRAETGETLSDPQFNLSLPLIHLERVVEMYQWRENIDKKTQEKLGGGTETTTVYEYQLAWATGRINSEDFANPQEHENPALRFSAKSLTANQVSIGAYPLSQSLINAIRPWKPIPIRQDLLSSFTADQQQEFAITEDFLYWYAPPNRGNEIETDATPTSEPPLPTISSNDLPFQTGVDTSQALTDPQNALAINADSIPGLRPPKLGDLRIRFQGVPPTEVSLVSGWSGSQFQPYRTSNGESIERLTLGNKTAAEIFQGLQQENVAMAWILRFLGFVLCALGFGMILAPLSTVASFVPVLGRMTGWLVTVVALLLALVVAATTIAIAWILVRPLLAGGLLLLAGGGLYGLYWMRKKTTPVIPDGSQ